MTSEPIRCTAPHPVSPSRLCNAWLTNAVRDSVKVSRGADPPPGCNELRCPRCGVRYVVCPAERAA